MFKYIRLGLTGGPALLASLPYLNKCLKEKGKHPLQERCEYIYKLANKCNKKAMHMEFIISGEENIPEGQAIFTPNHVSAADPIILLAAMHRPLGFIAKKETAEMPVIGKVLQVSEGKFLDREDLRSELKVFKETLKNMEENPTLSYAIFPEGTRAKAPDFVQGPFHPGSFKLATKGDYPIVPVAMYFTQRVLSSHYHYKKYPIQIRYLKPITVEDYKDMTTVEIAELVSNRIKESVEEMKALDRQYVKELNHYSDKKTDKVLFVKEKVKQHKKK